MSAIPPLEPPADTIKPADDQTVTENAFGSSMSQNTAPDTLPLGTIKAAIKSRADEAARQVANLRKERDQWNIAAIQQRNRLNARIKTAVGELAEAKRIANSLTPRKPRTKKAAK